LGSAPAAQETRMAKKQSRVPETREVKPNREQRRHPEKLRQPENEALGRAHEAQDEILKQGPQDVTDTRAKNSGHKKKTADNWNQ
jgi:hypothetical protein